MTVSDFISYWEQHIATRDSILHAHPPELRPAPPPAKAPAKILTIQSPYKQLVPPPDTSHTPQSSPPESNGDPEQVYSDTTLREVRKHGPSKGSVHKEETRLLYLKDWHFVAEYPDYHAYATPVYFQVRVRGLVARWALTPGLCTFSFLWDWDIGWLVRCDLILVTIGPFQIRGT